MRDLFDEIAELKRQKQAVILAHYYQEPDIQDVADFVGDSLELSRKAATTDAKIIVFAGVHFMAETAKILNPSKKVVLPDLKAGCSLASSCPPDLFARFKAKHPGAAVVSYINCSAEIKALSDYICTSSNAEKIVRAIPADRPVIFAPDRNLGAYLAKKIGRELILWNGSCIVHEVFSEKKLVQLKTRHPEAPIIAHPECEAHVLRHAEFIGSTSGLLKFTQTSPATKFIVVTESGILHQMRKASPAKEFIPAPPEANCACNDCPFMKLNTLEKIRDCLRDETPELAMGEELRARALVPLERMLAIS
ncbi:MAG: quinolinate synthase NadA [Deltaproteobacteria bacterium]|nr:quinolinate synthase NadA [Deltaproteobacteria bacterium]